MKSFTLALCASTTLILTGCSDRLYSHREEFAPKKASGVWNTERENLRAWPLSGHKEKPKPAQKTAPAQPAKS